MPWRVHLESQSCLSSFPSRHHVWLEAASSGPRGGVTSPAPTFRGKWRRPISSRAGGNTSCQHQHGAWNVNASTSLLEEASKLRISLLHNGRRGLVWFSCFWHILTKISCTSAWRFDERGTFFHWHRIRCFRWSPGSPWAFSFQCCAIIFPN